MDNQHYINSLHTKMHATFKTVINYLESHNLEWYVNGGTAIGAIRHHDFIPWDDDIDIYMPRTDYNRLVSLKEDIKQTTSLELLDIDEPGYTQWFLKIVDKNSTTLESFSIPLIYGVWVDVFPLDYTNDDINNDYNAKRYKQLFLEYQKSVFPFSFRGLIHDVFSFNIKSLTSRILNLLILKRKLRLRDNFKEYANSLQKDSGNCMISYCEGGRLLKLEWFESSLWFNFSDYQVRVPVGYDEYLRSVFGDYMVLPDEKDRITHQMPYLNLKERLSKEEIMNRLGLGESFVEE